MTTCACGASTEGEPFANGWARVGRLYREHVTPPVEIELWRCSACVNRESAWSFAKAVDYEEQFE
jgi:hypothetical protein